MVFADLFFVYIFFPLCLIAYFLARNLNQKNIVLIVFSLIFYAWGEPVYVLLLLFSAVFNWFMGLQIGKRKDMASGKAVTAIAIIVNLFFLVVFKYSGFVVENLNAIFSIQIPVPNVTLPIGISFFTFQAISYIIDCRWETVEPQRSFKNFLLYLSLFPQLIAGPIVRYSVIGNELTDRSVNMQDIAEGAMRVVAGLAKKVIIANSLYAIVTTFFTDDITGLSTTGTWYTVIIYALYVYFDFSGYSDMAIGMGRIFGFHFNENFTHPFACGTIAEFWQRWHISLGSFFRDYLLYVPIFGAPRKYLNLFLVWFCTGLWHGASWNFVLWGLYFGLFICFEQSIGKKWIKKWPAWVRQIYSKLVIVIGFGIFFFEDIGQLGQFFLNIFGINAIMGNAPFFDAVTWSSLLNNIFLIAVAIAISLPLFPAVKKLFTKSRYPAVAATGQIIAVIGCVALLAVSTLMLVDNTNNPFLYFRF
ncbi:MAG: MBOAT family protein [Oscillospiraceae bacterium]|nr:MBOAT family protein [Oscillospiraceae bacterium]